MKSLCALLAIGCLMGCGKLESKPAPVAGITANQIVIGSGVSAPFAPPVHHDWIAEVKAEARVRHMSYVIFCTPWQDDPAAQFQAMLCSDHCTRDTNPDEDNALDSMTWQAGMGATQSAAAQHLLEYIAMHGWNTPKPPHKKPMKSMEHKQCPPRIEGDYLATKDGKK